MTTNRRAEDYDHLQAATRPDPTSSGWRRCWLRLAAVVFGLLILVLAEGVCAVFNWGQPDAHDDPFVGFRTIQPLFVPDASGTQYEIAAARRKFFASQSFPMVKGPNAFRIFCFGGSTVQGRPFSTETSFTTWLRLALEQADSSRTWEVINCGGISYASYRLVPILEECLAYEPDVFIVCTGHNEFLEDRTYAQLRSDPSGTAAVYAMVARLRLVTLMREGINGATGHVRNSKRAAGHGDDRPMLTTDVDALLDYRNGLRAYHRNDAWRDGVVAHFRNNLTRMMLLARAAEVPVIFIRPPSNLDDCPPFKSELRGDITDDETDRLQTLTRDARDLYRSDLAGALKLLDQAEEVDDRCPHTLYELGQVHRSAGNPVPAREWFVRARDEDVCPLRMLSVLAEVLTTIAADFRIPLVDAHELLEQRCRDGILGDEMLVDHIHPSFVGHQMIADALLNRLAQSGRLHPADNWKERAHAAYKQHLVSLDDVYFLRGQRTLEILRTWTQGRADGPPIESRRGPKP